VMCLRLRRADAIVGPLARETQAEPPGKPGRPAGSLE
jgi:hypothetical protein